MGFCPYLSKLYSMQRDISYADDELDFEDSLDFDNSPDYGNPSDFYSPEDFDSEPKDEDVDNFDDMPRQTDPAEVDRIFDLLNSQFQYLYRELENLGLNINTIRYIFRYIISYTVSNQKMATGEPEQRTTALLNEMRRNSPWVFYILRSYGVPEARVNQIVRTLIAFTLSNIEVMPPVVPPQIAPQPPAASPVTPSQPKATVTETIEQTATRITNLMRLQTSIFRELQNFGITPSIANSIVRGVILFVLKNTDPNQPPANMETKTTELLKLFESSNAAMIKNLQGYGISQGQVSTLLRRIISFAVASIYSKK